MNNTVSLHAVGFDGPHACGAGAAPVIVLHGLFGSARNWQTFAQHLSSSVKTYTLDLRNHGNSPHCDAMHYTDLAGDVIQFLDDHDIAEARIIGHSMGGKTAMQLALDSPERVKQLVIVDIAPVSYDHNYEQLLGNLHGLDLSQITRRADANRLLGEAIDDDELRLFLLQNLLIKAGQAAVWRINLDAIRLHVNHLVQYSPDDGISPYEKSTHLIRGGESAYVKEAYYPIIRTLFPAVQFHTIAGAGHWPHAQKPATFLECIRGILAL
jgi:esterase